MWPDAWADAWLVALRFGVQGPYCFFRASVPAAATSSASPLKSSFKLAISSLRACTSVPGGVVVVLTGTALVTVVEVPGVLWNCGKPPCQHDGSGNPH